MHYEDKRRIKSFITFSNLIQIRCIRFCETGSDAYVRMRIFMLHPLYILQTLHGANNLGQ